MKTKTILCALCVIGAGAAANAASMCVPPTTGSYKYTTLLAEEANNRGEWTVGGSCSANNTTHTVSCSSTPNFRGEAHCSASGVYSADNWEEGGKFCWCRLTGSLSSNNYLSPRSGGWVLRNDNDSVSSCASLCALNCAFYAQSYRGFRRALFASPDLL